LLVRTRIKINHVHVLLLLDIAARGVKYREFFAVASGPL